MLNGSGDEESKCKFPLVVVLPYTGSSPGSGNPVPWRQVGALSFLPLAAIGLSGEAEDRQPRHATTPANAGVSCRAISSAHYVCALAECAQPL
jgi:hypothetical protein